MLSNTTAEHCQQPEQQCQWKLKQMLIVLHAGSKYTLDVLLQLGIKRTGPNPKLQQKSPVPSNCLDVKVPASPLSTQGLSAYLPFCQHPCCWSVRDPQAWRQLGSAECLGLVMFVSRKTGRTGKASKGYIGGRLAGQRQVRPSCTVLTPEKENHLFNCQMPVLSKCQWEIKHTCFTA